MIYTLYTFVNRGPNPKQQGVPCYLCQAVGEMSDKHVHMHRDDDLLILDFKKNFPYCFGNLSNYKKVFKIQREILAFWQLSWYLNYIDLVLGRYVGLEKKFRMPTLFFFYQKRAAIFIKKLVRVLYIDAGKNMITTIYMYYRIYKCMYIPKSVSTRRCNAMYPILHLGSEAWGTSAATSGARDARAIFAPRS